MKEGSREGGEKGETSYTHFILQGSGAFVYGWVAFADKLSYGTAVKIIQEMQPLDPARSVWCSCS